MLKTWFLLNIFLYSTKRRQFIASKIASVTLHLTLFFSKLKHFTEANHNNSNKIIYFFYKNVFIILTNFNSNQSFEFIRMDTADAKYCLIGRNSETEPFIDPNELLLVQEICCPEEYHSDLVRMISCQVILPRIKNTSDVYLKCSVCGELFNEIGLLERHKINSKDCTVTLKKRTKPYNTRSKHLKNIKRRNYIKKFES